jgi:hypothetical protein
MSLWKKPLLIAAAVLAMAAVAAPSAASAEDPTFWHLEQYEEGQKLPGPDNPISAAGENGFLKIRLAPGYYVRCNIPSVSGYVWNDETGPAGIVDGAQVGSGEPSTCQIHDESWWMHCSGKVTTNVGAQGWPILGLGKLDLQVSNIELEIAEITGKNCAGLTKLQFEGSITGQWDNESQELTWEEVGGFEDPYGGKYNTSGWLNLEAANGEYGPLTIQ